MCGEGFGSCVNEVLMVVWGRYWWLCGGSSNDF